MAAYRNVLLLIETSKAFGRKLLKGISRYMRESRCPWATYVEERGKREKPPSWVRGFDGDGVIAHSSSTLMVDMLRDLGLPLVETDMCGMDRDVPIVYSDETALVKLAIEHFLCRGITRIAWCQIANRPWCRFRRDALVRELNHRGLELVAREVPSRVQTMHWLEQRTRLGNWLQQLAYPTGVFCANDLCGTRLLEAARYAGVKVPDEVAVVGVDNDPLLCEISWPPLSSVEQNAEQIGYVSAKQLDHMLNGAPPPSQPIWVLPTGVKTRQSTDTLAIQQPDLVAALSFIRAQACSGIHVHDVVRHVSVSRSQLEKLFRTHLGHSPKAEIQRTRLELAKELLQADLSIGHVARCCGFKSTQYFSNVFQRELNMSPGRWRREHGQP